MTRVSPPDGVKVLEFVNVFATSGTERQVMNLAEGLDPSRFDVHVACLKRWGDLLERVEARGWPLTEYGADRVYGGRAWRNQLRFARDLRRRGIQIVHTYSFKVNLFGIPAARLAGTPVVVAGVRDTCDELTPGQRRVQRVTCRLADAVVVNADAIKQVLVGDGCDPERITVIGNGIDMTPFERRHEAGRTRQQLGLPAGAPIVAVLARLHPVKGLEYFLEAAAVVSARFPEARFLVVGEGRVVRDGAVVTSSYRQDLEACAARLGLTDRVYFTGFRRDVPELLAELAVSVLPCVANEGLSNSVLESMAAGVPVVATTVGGNPEAVEDGVTGLLVPPRDAAALSRAIGTILEDGARAARFGRAGQQRVAERFSVAHMVRQTERLYMELLSRKGMREAAAQLSEGTAT